MVVTKIKLKTVRIIIFISLVVSFAGFAQNEKYGTETGQQEQNIIPDSSFYPYKIISKQEAEKILGGPSHVKDSLRKNTNGYFRAQFTYKTNSADSLSGKYGALFFGYERYTQTDLAKRAYDLIKAENEKLYTVTQLDQTGDEGYTTKDQSGFPFIMIRKGNKVFKFKMYNVTSSNSTEELFSLMKKIVSEL